MTASLRATDDASAAVAVAPRVSLADIEAAIAEVHYVRGCEVIGAHAIPHPLSLLTICLVVMRNGFTIIGKSATASAENFNAELGRQFAYEDAVRQIWPLMGFALRDRLAARRGVGTSGDGNGSSQASA